MLSHVLVIGIYIGFNLICLKMDSHHWPLDFQSNALLLSYLNYTLIIINWNKINIKFNRELKLINIRTLLYVNKYVNIK